ncbi:E3 ubiquitin-protein ligase Mdm2-like, partial [Tigriopus californicus]|uniref:E3 ubiquitin-protein ligase Mdm2-like n=1 Tax=Tigriopus californicus TaxID=6832 RepID=UPI0027DAB0E7
MSPAHVAAAIENHGFRRFIPNSPLRKYLAEKSPELDLSSKSCLSLTQVLKSLKIIISRDKLFDEHNTFIILCDDCLEKALGMKALHLNQIREVVVRQLPLISDQGNLIAPASSNPNVSGLISGPRASEGAETTLSGSDNNPIVIPRPHGANIDQGPPAMELIPANRLFRVKPKFLEVLRQVKGVPLGQEIFSYSEVTRFLSQYIIQKKAQFFDVRNIKVAIVKGDTLGEAFGVKAFHRNQVTPYLRTQIIPYVPTSSKLEPNTPDSSSSARSNGNPSVINQDTSLPQSVELTTDLNVSSTTPISNLSIPKSAKMNCFMQPPTSNYSVMRSEVPGSSSHDSFISMSSPGSIRKRSNSEASEKESSSIVKSSPSPKAAQVSKRRRVSRSYSVVIHDFSSSDETIYSEQGYETVVLCSVDDSDHSDESNASTEVPDNAHQAEEEFTEFEVDTDSDHNNAENDEVDSAEDSDIEDVVLIASSLLLDQDTEFWADSESDTADDSDDVPLSNYDPELGGKGVEVWRCINCNEPNTPHMRLCSRCWKERNGWVPSRSHPRRRKKNKATKGQPIKGGSSNSKEIQERDSSDMETTEDENDRELDQKVLGTSRVAPEACSSNSNNLVEGSSSQKYVTDADRTGLMDSQTLSGCSQADSGYGLSQDSQEEADEFGGPSSKRADGMDTSSCTTGTTTTTTSTSTSTTTSSSSSPPPAASIKHQESLGGRPFET